jgi:hypothetical protein
MNVVFIGIDPGASGGLACVGAEGPAGVAVACKMPETDEGVLHWLRSHKAGLSGTTLAALEEVGGWVHRRHMETEGGARDRHTGSSMFKFGTSYGACKMALVSVGAKPLLVRPQEWQRALGVPPKGKSEKKTAFKGRLKEMAQGLYPALRVTLSTCDALLIAEYCRRWNQGLLTLGDKKARSSRKR